jgi:hypothetical protein
LAEGPSDFDKRLAVVEDFNWRLTARVNALELVGAALFADALAREPKDKRVEFGQALLHGLKAEARRPTMYDQSTPDGRRLADDTAKEMDQIISIFVEYLGRAGT